MDDTDRDHRPWIVAFIVLIVGVVGLSLLMGGQTSTILSTVGSSVGGPETGAGGGGGTTTDPSTGETTTGGGESSGQIADAAGGPPALLIVRTGTLELEVASVPSTVVAAGNLVTAAGGYTSGSDEAAAADDASASVTYRIPATAWDTTVTGLRALATTVRHQQIETEEVTGQVVDLGARIENLRATEAAFQAITARATKISDVLDVQKQLSATRGEIERLVADKTHLEGRAAYGSLRVTFHLPAPAAVTTANKGWDPAADVDRATGKLIKLGQWATSTAIFLAIVGLPIAFTGTLLLLIGWQLSRLARWLLARRASAAA